MESRQGQLLGGIQGSIIIGQAVLQIAAARQFVRLFDDLQIGFSCSLPMRCQPPDIGGHGLGIQTTSGVLKFP